MGLAHPWYSGELLQVPEMHTSPDGHERLHMPQFSESVCTAVHAPRQKICPAGHAHVPAVHDWPVAHTLPHAPQFMRSVLSAASQPVIALWSQSV